MYITIANSFNTKYRMSQALTCSNKCAVSPIAVAAIMKKTPHLRSLKRVHFKSPKYLAIGERKLTKRPREMYS